MKTLDLNTSTGISPAVLSAALVAFLALSFVAVPGTAQSLKGTMRQTPQFFAPGNARFVRLAGHHGTYAGATVTWESELVVDGPRLPEDRRISLAYHLAPETELLRSVPHGVEAVRAASGEVVGVELPASVRTRQRVRVTLRQPFEAPGELSPPLVAGRVVQRVSLDGVVYEPAAASATRLHPGYRAQKELSKEQIDWCDESLDELGEVTGVPIFVMPDSAFFAAGGLGGRWVDEQVHRRGRLLMVAAGFGVLLVVLGVGFYLLAGRARHEEADAFLRQVSES